MQPAFRRPRYLDIAEDLAARLPEYGPGGKLPTGDAACRAAAGEPADRPGGAIQELERRFLVRRYRGLGTFVATRIDYVVSAENAPSWHETVRMGGAARGSRPAHRAAEASARRGA